MRIVKMNRSLNFPSSRGRCIFSAGMGHVDLHRATKGQSVPIPVLSADQHIGSTITLSGTCLCASPHNQTQHAHTMSTNHVTVGTTSFYLANLLIHCYQFSWLNLAITHLPTFLTSSFALSYFCPFLSSFCSAN